MNKPTYSILIPVHNGARFLSATISSAIAQTRQADEIIVIDDASNDGSAENANSSEYKNHIQYFFNKQPTGFVDAWNRIISKANGDFVSMLHQDDLLHPDYLKHIELAVKTYPNVRHFYTACNYIDASGCLIKNSPLPHSFEPVFYSGADYAHNYLMGVISNNHIHRCPGVTTSRALLMNECPYRKEAGHIADDDLFYRIGRFTDVVGIYCPLASFRLHDESETAKADLTARLASDYIYQSLQAKSSDCIFSDADKQLIFKTAVKYINEMLFYRIKNNDGEGISTSLENADIFDNVVPDFMKNNLPAWAKAMWFLSRNSNIAMAKGYVAFLDLIKSLRDILNKEKK